MTSSTFIRAINLLSEQVQWGSPEMVRGGIDQSRLAIADEPTEAGAFSFMVMGDTDAGMADGAGSFSAGFAQQMMRQMGESRFLLHTGDVTYPVGNYENYLAGFLQPYGDLLNRLPSCPDGLKNGVIFNRPLLPVPGNHDYASLGGLAGGWQRCLRFVCDRLRGLGVDWGHYGGEGGEAYGRLFLDELKGLTPEQLRQHLATHYDADGDRFGGESAGGRKRCLNYRPGQFTRLPNRYYQFRYGGVDFFALDSNSWNMNSSQAGFDQAQLDWLVRSLVESWRSPMTMGRIVYLHHSPYTTEESRWQQSQTIWVRRHLRVVFDRVAAALAEQGLAVGGGRRPTVDLVLGGHAHCFEYMRTMQTHHADSEMDWIVCGGSGVDLRRQRRAGPDILEQLTRGGRSCTNVVAKSLLYRSVHGRNREQVHSFLRVDVNLRAARPFLVTPFLVRRSDDRWRTERLDALVVGGDRRHLQMALAP